VRGDGVAAAAGCTGDGVGAGPGTRAGGGHDDGPVHGVEHLPERDGRRHGRAGALVVAGVRDHEVLLGGADRVEEELAVLAARVVVAHPRVPGEEVVAVAQALAREGAVVQAEQHDHAMRHRAHRHQRADGQGSGAEPGPGGPPG